MQTYEREFIDFALECQALTFGEFTLKSGRRSPYFFNTGLFNTGGRLAKLGRFYAQAIVTSGVDFDLLYGPAYKGIPLVTAVAIAMWELYERDIPYAFNRKEIKDHGEGGMTVGAPLRGRVLIVDDVISAGTSVRESVEIIQDAGASPVSVAISLNRQERGNGLRSALSEVAEELALEVVSVTSLHALATYLAEGNSEGNSRFLGALEAYRSNYGAS